MDITIHFMRVCGMESIMLIPHTLMGFCYGVSVDNMLKNCPSSLESSTSEPAEDFKGFKKTRDFGDFQV